jgi:hypothetical protein
MTLIITLLTDESFTSVHSYPDVFPQFNYSRETKTLREDVDSMRDFDTSTLKPEVAEELEGAIAQVDEMLKNKAVNVEEFKAANDRFYEVFNQIQSGEGVLASRGLNRVLYVITKTVSDILYAIFGDKAFSEIFIKPIIDLL